MKNQTDRSLDSFQQERLEALLSLDQTKIQAYCDRWGATQPDIPTGSLTWWAGVHKARLVIGGIPKADKELSRRWLKANGFQEGTF
jgi:hypothetical protein